MRYIKIKVLTRAKKDSLRQISEDKFECAVREKPENNKANEKVIKILADFLNLAPNQLKIIKGRQQPNKIILIGF